MKLLEQLAPTSYHCFSVELRFKVRSAKPIKNLWIQIALTEDPHNLSQCITTSGMMETM